MRILIFEYMEFLKNQPRALRQRAVTFGRFCGVSVWIGVILAYPIIALPPERFLDANRLVEMIFKGILLGLIPAFLAFVAGFIFVLGRGVS